VSSRFALGPLLGGGLLVCLALGAASAAQAAPPAASRSKAAPARSAPAAPPAASRSKAAPARSGQSTGKPKVRERGAPSAPSAPSAPAASQLSPRATQAIGSLSIGHPHAGFLMNAVRMPEGPYWSIGLPAQAFGTEETIQSLAHCIERVQQQFPGSPRIVIGTISAERGGALKGHKSHRTGRDADVALYYIDGKWHWREAAGAHNLDRARTWAFLRAVITETDVEFVLVDRAVQSLLEEHALAIGEDPAWVNQLFYGSTEAPAIVKHVPGHTAHMHIRFISPLARERGRLAYDQLVAQGHIETGSRTIEHTVVEGDTLLDLAASHASSVALIQRKNGLDSSEIRVGQVLQIDQREELRGARDPVLVPARRLPAFTPLALASPAPRTPPIASSAPRVRPRAARVWRVRPSPAAAPSRSR
jgi:penicillin-insensitive murein endopeptidase